MGILGNYNPMELLGLSGRETNDVEQHRYNTVAYGVHDLLVGLIQSNPNGALQAQQAIEQSSHVQKAQPIAEPTGQPNLSVIGSGAISAEQLATQQVAEQVDILHRYIDSLHRDMERESPELRDAA